MLFFNALIIFKHIIVNQNNMSMKCDKYYQKAYRLEKEIERLKERIGDLKSGPQNDATKKRIEKLELKKSDLETKHKYAVDAYEQCISNYPGDK